MKIKRLSEQLLEIEGKNGEKFRIEKGPRRRRAVATEELLSDEATAKHYFAGTRKEMHGGKEIDKVGVDALNKPIVIGEEMDFIDWRSWNAKTDGVFNIYELVNIKTGDVDPATKKKAAAPISRFLTIGVRESEEDALSLVTEALGA